MYNVWRPLARRCQLLWNSGISLQPGSLILDTHGVSLTGFSIGLGQLNNLYAMKTQSVAKQHCLAAAIARWWRNLSTSLPQAHSPPIHVSTPKSM
jgi:hypothetical protein